MISFEKKLDEYKTRLANNAELAIITIENAKTPEIQRILISPSNEEELEYANTMLTINQDMKTLTEYASNGRFKGIDFKNSIIKKFTKALYDKIKDSDLSNPIDLSDMNMDEETFVTLTYEIMIVSITDSGDLENYLCELSQNNPLDQLKFLIGFNQSISPLKPSTDNSENTKNIMDKVHVLFQKEIANLQDENNTTDTRKTHIK